jgi:hypothetical protein
MLQRAPPLLLLPLLSSDVSLVGMMFKLKSFIAVFVIRTFIKSVTSGVQCPLSILVFLDMKLLVVLQKWEQQSQSLNLATLLQLGVW